MESILKYTEITKKSPKKQTHQNPKTLNDDKGKKKKTQPKTGRKAHLPSNSVSSLPIFFYRYTKSILVISD